MVRIGSLALIAMLACGAARAAVLDAETPDDLIPDAPGATIETQRGADGRLQIDIRGERFDGRRLIKRLLTDMRDAPSAPTGADFDLHIAVGTLAGHNGEELRHVDLRLVRRGGRIDDFALTGRTSGGAAVLGDVRGGGAGVRRALHRLAGPVGTPRLLINPFIETLWRFTPPP